MLKAFILYRKKMRLQWIPVKEVKLYNLRNLLGVQNYNYTSTECPQINPSGV